jgi:hypothetical protein
VAARGCFFLLVAGNGCSSGNCLGQRSMDWIEKTRKTAVLLWPIAPMRHRPSPREWTKVG